MIVLEDPNTNLTLWESGAIILYIIENYNPKRALTFDTLNERHLLNQWLAFQISGQGPYYGQSAWLAFMPIISIDLEYRAYNANVSYYRFNHYHPEKIQSAIDRYSDQLKRVLSVIEGHLSGTAPAVDSSPPGPREWLVGDKMTFADLAFAPWNELARMALPTGPAVDPLEEFPHVQAWHKRMTSRESFQKVWAWRTEGMKAQDLGQLGLPEGKGYDDVMEEIAKEKAEKGTESSEIKKI